MGKQLEVAVCGDGLMAAGIAASLQARGDIRVSRLGSSLTEAAPAIKMLAPHAVIFEMTRDELAAIGGVLRDEPGLTLVGVDREQDAVTVFTAGRQTIKTGEELAQMIAARENANERD